MNSWILCFRDVCRVMFSSIFATIKLDNTPHLYVILKRCLKGIGTKIFVWFIWKNIKIISKVFTVFFVSRLILEIFLLEHVGYAAILDKFSSLHDVTSEITLKIYVMK